MNIKMIICNVTFTVENSRISNDFPPNTARDSQKAQTHSQRRIFQRNGFVVYYTWHKSFLVLFPNQFHYIKRNRVMSFLLAKILTMMVYGGLTSVMWR